MQQFLRMQEEVMRQFLGGTSAPSGVSYEAAPPFLAGHRARRGGRSRPAPAPVAPAPAPVAAVNGHHEKNQRSPPLPP